MEKATEILKTVSDTGQDLDLARQVLYTAIRDCTQKVDVGYYKRVIDSMIAADLIKSDRVKNDQGEVVNTLYSLTPIGQRLVRELGEKLDKHLKGEEHGQT